MVSLRTGVTYERPPKAPKGPKKKAKNESKGKAKNDPKAPQGQAPGKKAPPAQDGPQPPAPPAVEQPPAEGQGTGTGAADDAPKDDTKHSRRRSINLRESLLQRFKRRVAKRRSGRAADAKRSRLVVATRSAITRLVKRALAAEPSSRPALSDFVRQAQELLARLKRQKATRPAERSGTAEDGQTYVHDLKDAATMNKHTISWVGRLADHVGTLSSPRLSRRFAAIILTAMKTAPVHVVSEVGNPGRKTINALRAYLEGLPMAQATLVQQLAEFALREPSGLTMTDYLCRLEATDESSAMTLMLCHATMQVSFFLLQSIAIEWIYMEARMLYPSVDKARFALWIAQDGHGPLPTHVLSGPEAGGKVCFKCKQAGSDCPN